MPAVSGLLALVWVALMGALAGPSAAVAQVVPVDRATFELTRDGQVVGQEEVTLQRMGVGQGARLIGQSEIRMADGTLMRPRLEATAAFRATTYQNRFSGAREGEIQVTRAGRRLVARTEMRSGEAQREFPASDQTVLLEEDVVLLYYLVRPWLETAPATLAVLNPRTSRQSRMQATVLGTEEIRVGREVFACQRLRLTAGDDVRDVWLDPEGRVMRVDVAASGFSARRITN